MFFLFRLASNDVTDGNGATEKKKVQSFDFFFLYLHVVFTSLLFIYDCFYPLMYVVVK